MISVGKPPTLLRTWWKNISITVLHVEPRARRCLMGHINCSVSTLYPFVAIFLRDCLMRYFRIFLRDARLPSQRFTVGGGYHFTNSAIVVCWSHLSSGYEGWKTLWNTQGFSTGCWQCRTVACSPVKQAAKIVNGCRSKYHLLIIISPY